jgi:hypothetical protein
MVVRQKKIAEDKLYKKIQKIITANNESKNNKIKRRKNQFCCKLSQDFKSFIRSAFG